LDGEFDFYKDAAPMALESATFRWFTVRMAMARDFSLDVEATRSALC